MTKYYQKLLYQFLLFQFKLGMSLMKLSFNLESWEACGGGPELSGSSAIEEGNRYIDKALKIFEEVCLLICRFFL